MLLIFRFRNALRRFHGDIERLAEKGGVEATPALLDVLNVEDRNLRLKAVKGLVRILPQLQPADAASLTARHKWRLKQTFSTDIEFALYKDVHTLFHPAGLERPINRLLLDFRLATLKAIGEIGDESDRRRIERFAQKGARQEGRHEARTPAQKEVHQATLVALSRLKERLAETEPQRLLLRASGVQAAPEELLRPSRSESEAPEELLRPDVNAQKALGQRGER
jgi:hypothetical protein